MKTAVIISTYNNPEPLRRVLLGFLVQDTSDFEIVISDDGSDEHTRAILDLPEFAPLSIRHVWHADKGFRLSAIRNRALAQTDADYAIFCDGDCIPRNDFVASHLRYARRGQFVAGHRINVAPAVHQQFTDDGILTNRIFELDYLTGLDKKLGKYRWRLERGKWWEPVMNAVTFRYCVFSGSNSSAWRDDLLAVNGFDESFAGYGSEDRDMGIRLRNSGVRSRFLKFSLIQMHLDHAQAYYRPEIAAENRRRFRARARDRTTRIELGVDSVMSRP